jgi:hypothetical protein
MSFYDEYEGTPFVPQSCVRKVLEHFEKKRYLWWYILSWAHSAGSMT